MRVIIKEPNEAEKIIDISNDFDTFRCLLGGYVEVVRYPKLVDKGLVLLVNEEGKLEGLKENLLLTDSVGRVREVLVGTVLICSTKFEVDDYVFEDISDEQVKFINKNRFTGFGTNNDMYDILETF